MYVQQRMLNKSLRTPLYTSYTPVYTTLIHIFPNTIYRSSEHLLDPIYTCVYDFLVFHQTSLTSTLNVQPSHAKQVTIPVKHNDLIITATDGLFDNLFPGEICAVVDQSLFTEALHHSNVESSSSLGTLHVFAVFTQ